MSIWRSNAATATSKTISVKIPAGVDEGKKIRLRGQGESIGGPAGNLLLTVHVAAHPYFHRSGMNLEVRLPVTLAEAVAGAKVDVPTPRGTISLRIPAAHFERQEAADQGAWHQAGQRRRREIYSPK